MTHPESIQLPDLLTFRDGRRVEHPAAWPTRRQELMDAFLSLQYGGLPPQPSLTRGEELHTNEAVGVDGARDITYRVGVELNQPFAFPLRLLVPPGAGPFPVVLRGDACWGFVSDEIVQAVLRRGVILAQFNRVDLAADAADPARATGIYPQYPGASFGGLAAWAWGYHRCVDVLVSLPFVNPQQIAVVGHSRGGKASLLAGVTDERIALTSANNSGCGGAGCYRLQGPNSEALSDILTRFPYWFGPHLGEYIGRESTLPFDQHFLKACVAPRLLLTTEGLGDLWANPTGTWHTHAAAAAVYRFLGIEDRIGIWYREGGHAHGVADWNALLDFMDWHFRGRKPTHGYSRNPFAAG